MNHRVPGAPAEDADLLDALRDPELGRPLRLVVLPPDSPLPARAPIGFIPVATSAHAEVVYGYLSEPLAAQSSNGQIYSMTAWDADLGCIQGEASGIRGLIVGQYFVEGASAVRALLEKRCGLALPEIPRGRLGDLREETEERLGLRNYGGEVARIGPDDDPGAREVMAALAPHDGEVLVESIQTLADLGRTAEALALVPALDRTWRHTWGRRDRPGLVQALRDLGVRDDGTQLGFEVEHPDFQTRFRKALTRIEAGDWHGGTKWIHDLSYEEGDFHSVLPLLARGFRKMGWDWAVEACLRRTPTAEQKARWPFDLTEALKH